MGGVHLAEVPLEAEDQVAPHHQLVSVLFVVGGDRMCQVPSLIQDVVALDAQVEGADALVDLRIPCCGPPPR